MTATRKHQNIRKFFVVTLQPLVRLTSTDNGSDWSPAVLHEMVTYKKAVLCKSSYSPNIRIPYTKTADNYELVR